MSRRRTTRGSSSTTDHEMSSLRPGEVRSSLNSCDAAWTTPIAEEPNGNVEDGNAETASFPLTPKRSNPSLNQIPGRPKSSTFPSTGADDASLV